MTCVSLGTSLAEDFKDLLRQLTHMAVAANLPYVTVEGLTSLTLSGERERYADFMDPDIMVGALAALADESVLYRHGPHFIRTGGYSDKSLEVQVCRLLERSCAFHARAVRLGDLTGLPAGLYQGLPLASRADNGRRRNAIQKLLRDGRVIEVGRTCGESAMGNILWLPAALEHEADAWLPTMPLTLRDYVNGVIDRLADQAGAFTTAQLRAAMIDDANHGVPVATERWGIDLASPMSVVSLLQRASKGNEAYIVPIVGARASWRRKKDGASAQLYALDSDRVLEASRRAVGRSGRPSFTHQEVDEEIALDGVLSIAGSASPRQILSDLAKESIDDGTGLRRPRRRRAIVRLGTIGDIAHYWVDRGTGGPSLAYAQRSFTESALMSALSNGDLALRSRELDHCQSRALRNHRAEQLVAEAEGILKRVELFGGEIKNREDVIELRGLHRHLASAFRFRGRRGGSYAGSREALMEPLQVRDLIGPFSAVVAKMTSSQEVTRHFFRSIRRVPNPDFESRRAEGHRRSAAFLFDGVSARLYLANQWGGATARLMAAYAGEELGDCRDSKVVLRAIEEASGDERVRTIAAAAFLGSHSLAPHVVDMACNMSEEGLRLAALWATGALLDEQASLELVRDSAVHDPSEVVRRMARSFAAVGEGWVWKV